MPRKYRGKYTNARDCKHANGTEGLMASVWIKEGCPHYGKFSHDFVPVAYCQNGCEHYEKGAEGGGQNVGTNQGNGV